MAMQRIPYNIIVHSLSLASLSSSLKEGAKGTSCQREAKSLPCQAWAYELPYHHLQIVYSRNRRAAT